MIEGLKDAGLPIKVVRAPIATAANVYSEAAVSFNCSLNGDLNLRIFEVLACGGCLLTDKLSDAAGLDLLLEEGAHYFSYGAIPEAVERARFLLSNPDAARGVALAGQRIFKEGLHPGQMARRLLEWVAQGKLEARFSVPPETPVSRVAMQSRLACYEQLQELQKQLERPRVLVYGKADPAIVKDACDLHRLDLHFTNEQGAPDDSQGAASPEALSDGSWDCIVKPRYQPLPPHIRSAVVQEV